MLPNPREQKEFEESAVVIQQRREKEWREGVHRNYHNDLVPLNEVPTKELLAIACFFENFGYDTEPLQDELRERQ